MAAAAMATSGVLFQNYRKPQLPKIPSVSRTNATSFPGLGSLTSQFNGIRISHNTTDASYGLSTNSAPALQPIVASRVCPFTGKRANKANKVSFSNHKTIKRQQVNLQYKRIWWENGKRWVYLKLSTKALKTIEKNGLDAMAKKAGIDLSKK
ncbi:60S ribosomal protein L28 [Turnera subulata]|uniref:Large ribosomal subunit protein bL28c n=1 Tax=Turnera subulata TaxID=218843 RepID=A0A9Q0FNT4_9ROSI|nr:60S ribosomal protein L28 [Turnera subulata]